MANDIPIFASDQLGRRPCSATNCPLEPVEDETFEDVSCCLMWDLLLPVSGSELSLEVVRMVQLRELRRVEAWDRVIASRRRTGVPLFGAWSRQAVVVGSGADFDVEVCTVCEVFVSECLLQLCSLQLRQ